MTTCLQKITPCLWFADQAEEAANFYVSIFPNSRVCSMSRYGEAGRKEHGQAPGTVMVVAFELEGQAFTALNGGPVFKLNEAVSFVVNCETQEEIDHYWNHLSEGGEKKAQQCGWLKDRYGASWQIVPAILPKMLTDNDPAKPERVMEALLKMKKIDINALKHAFAGE
jgi:predicted 3-demethylubiquinone-9 3-methyltransferase (glyoxalase superfamily)